MNTTTIQLVVFDLGRVLIRICDSWRHACERAGIAAPALELDDAGKAAMNDLVHRHETGGLDDAGFFAAAGRVLGLTTEQTGRTVAAYLIEPYPGVCEMLAGLKAKGVKTACLSNTNAGHWNAMCGDGPCGLPLHELDWRFASQEIGHRKPGAAIYEHVERVTGMAGDAIVFFDDNADNVAAARGRGWRACLIADDGDPMKQVRKHLRALGLDD